MSGVASVLIKDSDNPRIVKAELAGVKTTSSVVDDSGRGGCMKTRTFATGTLPFGPEKFVHGEWAGCPHGGRYRRRGSVGRAVAVGSGSVAPTAIENYGSSTLEHAPKKPAVICVAAGENLPSPKAAVRPTDRRAAAESSPLQGGTAAQQGVSRGQDPAVAYAAAEKNSAVEPMLHEPPSRSGVTPAPVIWGRA